MKLREFCLTLFVCGLVTACGKDDAAMERDTSNPPSAVANQPSTAAPSMEADQAPTAMPATPSGAAGETRYIDHVQDEVEFRLKKSLAGLESLLEDVSDSEQVAMIKKDIAAIQAKLDAL